MRRVVVSLLAVVFVFGLAGPVSAQTAPVDSLASARTRVVTELVGVVTAVDGGRVDLSANGQYVVFDRPGRGIGVYDSVQNNTLVLGGDTAKPFAVSDSGGVVLYTDEGQPWRWARSNGRTEILPWNGGVVTDMALDQTGLTIAYTEQTSSTSGILRTWVAPSNPEEAARVRSFGATITPAPGPRDRDVFVTAPGTSVLFRVGSSVRGVDVASGTASAIPLTTLTGLDRQGVRQVEPGTGAERFRIGESTATARTSVNYPPPTDAALSALTIAGDGTSVVFHSQSELYRWKQSGQLIYLQPAQSIVALGDPRDSSISGRFVLTSRPGPGNSILEIIDTNGVEVPIVAVSQLQGSQLSDQVLRLYLAYFDRGPDASGGSFWRGQLARGANLNDISSAFSLSEEFKQTYGALSDAEFVDLVYMNVLGRAPDAGGRSFWISQLAAGASRGQVMTEFSEATEFRNRTGTSTPLLSPPTARQVERLYRAYFNRSADQGGLDFWLEAFANGAVLGDLSNAFAASTEFQTTYGALSNEGFVDLVYLNVLSRAPDASGRAFWVGQLDTGSLSRGQVMVGFSESPEFILATDTLR